MIQDTEATMKRYLWLGLVSTVLVSGGCLGEGTYTQRVEGYTSILQDAARRDKVLNPPEGGSFPQFGITFRLPKSMTAGQPFLQLKPGDFDLTQFYIDNANSGVQIAVLDRLRNPPPAPDGQAPLQRDNGPFQLLVGALVGQGAPALENVFQGGVTYKRFSVDAEPTNPNDMIQVYLHEKGNHEIAIITKIPKSAANAPLVTDEIPLSLGSLQTN